MGILYRVQNCWIVSALTVSALLAPGAVSATTLALYANTVSGYEAFDATGHLQYSYTASVPQTDGLAVDSAGNVFLSSDQTNQILKVSPQGVSSVFANISAPSSLAFDPSGNLYTRSGDGGGTIYETTPAGQTTVFATGLHDGSSLRSIATDLSGNVYGLYVTGNNGTGLIEKYLPNGVGSVFASGLSAPTSLAVDSSGNVFVGSFELDDILRITPGGNTSIFSNAGVQYLAIDQNNNIYSDGTGGQGQILEITPDGVASVFVAGTGTSLGVEDLQVGTFAAPEPGLSLLCSLGLFAILVRRRRSQRL